MRISRAVCINDLSGFGRCSLTTAISVLSAAGVQACPVPTAVLSKHTGFKSFYFKDLTESLEPYMKDWEELSFDGIYSGFLGSAAQIHAVEKFIKKHKAANTPPLVIVDPVMGDGGKLYATYTEEMRADMKNLAVQADILTPNITEACFLTETPYKGEEIEEKDAFELIQKIAAVTKGKIVLTGIVQNDKIINMTYDSKDVRISEVKREIKVFSGTGDIFASIVTAFVLKGSDLYEAVNIAGKFISAAIERTINSKSPLSEGIIFEPILYRLGEI